MRFFCAIILCIMFAAGCAGASQGDGSFGAPPGHDNSRSVSFVCVGDNLIHEQIWRSRDKEADGRYNFESLYAPVKELVSAADVAFVNQETVCGGEALALSDWPRFNSPQEILDALAKTGFTWISTANNHALDRGEDGIRAQLDYLSRLERVVSTGTHASREDRETPRVMEIKGIRIGLASYTYGTNGIAPPPGKEFLVDVIDEERMRADLSALAHESDIQIVAMHWGDENSLEPTDGQKRLAQMLADSGADVVIGTHPHVFQAPVVLEGAAGNTTLVYYSLGNFMSSQTEPDQMLGAMACFEIGHDSASGEARLLSAEALPLVTHISSDYQVYEVYPFGDYTEGLAAGHALAAKGLSQGSLASRARELFGESGYWE